MSGETHYKAALETARVQEPAFEERRMAGLAEGAAKLSWDEMETVPGLHRFMDYGRVDGRAGLGQNLTRERPTVLTGGA